MKTLPLSPLPSDDREEKRIFRRIESEGFIDEQVVSRVIALGAYDRSTSMPNGMVLSSSRDDYAGWAPPIESPFRNMTNIVPAASTPARMPKSPSLGNAPDVGIDTPYKGGHRWWLFGVSGAITCCIMALTILGLTQRNDIAEMTSAPFPAQKWHGNPAVTGKQSASQPALTKVLPAER